MFSDNGSSQLSKTIASILQGRTVVLAPHIDDEVLGCGGLIAQAPDPSCIEIIYATDGSSSHKYMAPHGVKVDTANLVAVRQAEARCALEMLNVPPTNLHFMNMSDGSLMRQKERLTAELVRLFKMMQPDVILVPFRYDRHPDHIALHHAAVKAAQGMPVHIFEYFVYHYWRELPGRDVRVYLNTKRLHTVSVDQVVDQKRCALACNVSQFTNFYSWQTRPVVNMAMAEKSLAEPEVFHEYDPHMPGLRVIERHHLLVAGVVVSQRIFPTLKRIRHALL